MAETVYNYRLYCNVEGENFTTWRSESDGLPTQCPHCLTTDIRDIVIIDTVKSADVNIASQNTALDLAITNHGFQDLTGYNVYVPGYRFVASPGQINNFDVSYDVDYKLQGMEFKVNDKSVDGDKVSIQLVDVDGIVYPAGTVLITFASNLFVAPNHEFKSVCADAKTFYSWMYTRMVYDSVGDTDNVVIYWNQYLRTIPV